MTPLFVTATGTGVGKTALVCTLLQFWQRQGLEARALKPVISGFSADDDESDTHRLLRAMDEVPSAEAIDAVSPWRFEAPLSPDVAADREGRSIDFDALVDFCRKMPATDRLLIEGVGGAFVPLDADHTVADWIKALDIPAVVVAGAYLGTLSHTIATVEALHARNISVSAVIISEAMEAPMPAAETQAVLARFLKPVSVGLLPRGGATASETHADSTMAALTALLE